MHKYKGSVVRRLLFVRKSKMEIRLLYFLSIICMVTTGEPVYAKTVEERLNAFEYELMVTKDGLVKTTDRLSKTEMLNKELKNRFTKSELKNIELENRLTKSELRNEELWDLLRNIPKGENVLGAIDLWLKITIHNRKFALYDI